MIARIGTATLQGVTGVPVTVEVDVSNGIPAFEIVGLPNRTIKEAKDRIRAAIMNCGLIFPGKRITVNLSPADVSKEGSQFDLPIAIGILAASGSIDAENAQKYALMGELSLDGSLKRVKGILPMAVALKMSGASEKMIVPEEASEEASLVDGLSIFGARGLAEAAEAVNGSRILNRCTGTLKIEEYEDPRGIRLEDVRGQESAKRALIIAAAGEHSMIMVGGPGCGKSMLARCLPGILPPLEKDEMIELTGIYSAAGLLDPRRPVITRRPFRAPHYSIPKASLMGGGLRPVPGEFTLAHKAVLFLDELGEFSSGVLDAMRAPLEDGYVNISRSGRSVTFPGKVQLIAASNPCPCGNLGVKGRECVCSAADINRYRSRLTGPFMDRIDITVRMEPVSSRELRDAQGITTEEAALQVLNARRIQTERYKGETFSTNARMFDRSIRDYCDMDGDALKLLEKAYERYSWSARAYHKMMKTARTIADLDSSEKIRQEHAAEAIMYMGSIF